MRLQAYEQISFKVKYGGYIYTQTALDFKLNLELKLKTISHKVFGKK